MKEKNENGFLDAHLHLYPPKRLAGLIKWMHGFFPDHPVPPEATLDDVLADLREHGYGAFVALVFPLSPGESEDLNSFIAAMAERVHFTGEPPPVRLSPDL